MIYFTSDTHFKDREQITVRRRPFSSTDEMDRVIVERINETVSKNDTLYHLGDFSYLHKPLNEDWREGMKLVKQIEAEVILILGNNERRIINDYFGGSEQKFIKYCMDCGFAGVYPELHLTTEKHSFYLSHEPTKKDMGAIKLHGHIHRLFGITGCRCGVNVATDLHYFSPIPEDEAARFYEVDHLDAEYVLSL